MEEDSGEEGDTNSEPHSEAEVRLAWVEPEVQAPAELAFIWKDVASGKRKLDKRGFLEACPKFKGLPQKPPDNNNRLDNKKAEDKTLKAWQASFLQICRGQMFLYTKLMQDVVDKQDVFTLYQKIFQLCAEMCFKVENQRREISIPGSSTASSTSSLLFEKKELDQVALIQPYRLGPYSFLSYIQGFRFKFSKSLAPKEEKALEALEALESHFDLHLGKAKVVDSKEGVEKVSPPSQERLCQENIPCFQSLLIHMPWWQEYAPSFIQILIGQGVSCPNLPSYLSLKDQNKGKTELELRKQILEEYHQIGAVKLVNKRDARHLVPWFIISKKDNTTNSNIVSSQIVGR